ncbi:MAG: ATP-dependent sacrificial sulfur transferase LarE [Candidatus Latescibacteria bacterium]|nr:ATP-dependent sacrificial sulfur transferase LarE [Candidatus Latescibacterota bacterium]
MILKKKFNNLKISIKNYGAAAVAFSGGVDSTFLAKATYNALGEKALAITVDSEAYPPESIIQTRKLAKLIGIRLLEIPQTVTNIPRFCANPTDRCYHCKKALFSMMLKKAEEEGINVLMDGSNTDDDSDFRPGKRALKELNIKSPLKEHGFSKDDIRAVSKELGLPTWKMQSFACLASRFPYGHQITPELLARTGKAEAVLRELGIHQYRVRNHGDIARIEVDEEGLNLLMDKSVREKVTGQLKSLGYTYVALDLEGYRTGSLNEILDLNNIDKK